MGLQGDFFNDFILIALHAADIGAHVRRGRTRHIAALGHFYMVGRMAREKFGFFHRLTSAFFCPKAPAMLGENCSFIKRAERIWGSLGMPPLSA